MIRISRLTDYGIVLMSHMAAHGDRVHNATEVAAEAHLPLPTVSKLLRLLAKEGLLESHRGVKGGYGLARPAEDITVGTIITALEGPIAITTCTNDSPGECEHEPHLPGAQPLASDQRRGPPGARQHHAGGHGRAPRRPTAAHRSAHRAGAVRARAAPRGIS